MYWRFRRSIVFTRERKVWKWRHTYTWNNGNRNPGWGVAEIQKMSPPNPQQLGDVIVVTNSPHIGLMRSQLTNQQEGIILDVRAWS